VGLFWLDLVRFKNGVSGEVELTERGMAFDDAVNIYGDRDQGAAILRDAYLGLPATQVLMQGLHGRGPVRVEGALHLLVRHDIALPGEETRLRRFLQVLNDLDIVAYSNKLQTVRIVATMPVQEEPSEPKPSVRVIEKARPYSNIRHMRETLRECKEYIWWVDPHFEMRGLELLADEADVTHIKEIKILSGGRPEGKHVEEFKRFKEEMKKLGIDAEWRMVEKPDVEFHNRFVVTKDKAWDLPPIAALYTGKYSQISETTPPPPFGQWFAGGVSVEDL
jgi:hypothetical protein